MIPKMAQLKTLVRLTSICTGAALLSGCLGSSLGDFSGQSINSGAQPVASGEVLGTGTVRVGLLLPLSGNNSSIAMVFKNAAELALANFPNADVQLLVKDTGGSAQGGRAAAQAAISEGAELILGPVFSSAVSGAASVARPSNVPIVAFSSDSSVAARGVYLLSFLPQSDAKRVVSYASSQSKRSFAALLPDDSYGAVAEAAFRQEVGNQRGQILAIQRYSFNGGSTADLLAKTDIISQVVGKVDALFIPAGGGVAPLVMQTMTQKGINLGSVKILGSGLWDTADMKNNPIMTGSWFPGPERSGYGAFSSRYQTAFGTVPPRNATLAYDGVTLAAGLVRSAGQQRFSTNILTSKDGFIGIDGLFRFMPSGENERGLAVYQLTGNGTQVISPAPRDFRSGT
ncbi:MAG: penicillin-binding protein activator [Rhodobacteraceae bacterium]|nr:penicillin-binding protein activator [Paracoccaceae bacterium]